MYVGSAAYNSIEDEPKKKFLCRWFGCEDQLVGTKGPALQLTSTWECKRCGYRYQTTFIGPYEFKL